MVISLPQIVGQILGSHQQKITMEDSTLRVLGSWHPGFPTSDDLILKIFNILKITSFQAMLRPPVKEWYYK